MQHRTARNRPLKTALVATTVLSLLGVAGISFAAAGDPAGIQPRVLAVGDLIQQRDEVFADLKSRTISGVDGFSVGIDPDADEVRVVLFTPESDVANAIALDLGANVKVDVAAGEAPTSFNAHGGSPLTKPGEGPFCTAGFTVSVDGRQGMVTAGHCFGNSAATDLTLQVNDVRFQGHSKSLDKNDYGLMTTIDPSTAAQAVPSIKSSELTGDEVFFGVLNTVEPKVGDEICKEGITTGTTCGTITLIETRAVFREQRDTNGNLIIPSYEVEGLFMSTACMEPGDSGGPVYRKATSADKVLAVGINTGGSGKRRSDGGTDCFSKSGGRNISYHLPLKKVPAGVSFALL